MLFSNFIDLPSQKGLEKTNLFLITTIEIILHCFTNDYLLIINFLVFLSLTHSFVFTKADLLS